MSDILAWTIAAPLAGAALAYLAGRRGAPLIGLATAAITLALVGVLVWRLELQGPLRHSIGGWGAPLGIDLYADGLSAAMLLLTAVVCALVSLYAVAYFRDGRSIASWRATDSFWPLWLFLWSALNSIFLSADIFNLYVGLELMTLPAVALIVLAPQPRALTAAMRYLLAAFVGSLAYLLGVALLYASFDSLDISLLAERMALDLPVAAAISLITVGLALKTALFPLHFWLPPAHASAPGPVSAVLSALVVKASFYVMLRLWFYLFPEALTTAATQLLGFLGAAAIVWASLRAIRAQRLKLLIAYSTVAQLGYLFLLIPLALASVGPAHGQPQLWHFDAWNGGIYHALSHGLAKASMFMAAGIFTYALGDDDRLVTLPGIASRLPLTTFSFGLAGLNLMGVPPTGGFVAKWLLLHAAVASGQWWWALVVAIGSMLAGGYLAVVLKLALARPDAPPKPLAIPRLLELPTLALALIALLLGLRAVDVLPLLEVGRPFVPLASAPVGGG